MDNNDNVTDHPDHTVTVVVPISFKVDISTWALEYGLRGSEAREDFAASLRNAVAEGAFGDLIRAGWHVMDLADIEADGPVPDVDAEEAANVLWWWASLDEEERRLAGVDLDG